MLNHTDNVKKKNYIVIHNHIAHNRESSRGDHKVKKYLQFEGRELIE